MNTAATFAFPSMPPPLSQTEQHAALLLLNDFREQLRNTLHTVLPEFTHPHELYLPFHYVMHLEGKYMRPLITMLCAHLKEGTLHESLYAGLALEIMHTFTLVHDDIMDKSPLRRGQPSVHQKWNESTAILSGDVMMGVAYELLLQHVRAEHVAPVLKIFTRGFIDVCEGQALDMSFAERAQVSMDEYLVMIEKKTARLPQTAARIGAVLAELDEAQTEAVAEFALQTGIAFQIQDDVLDLQADQAELGKRVGQDVLEGKQTYLIVQLLHCVPKDSDDYSLLQRFLDEKGLPESMLDELRQLMQRYGVFASAELEISRRYDIALSALDALPDGKAKNGLQLLTHTLGERRK